MIRESKDYQRYENREQPKIIEYEDGDAFDFLDYEYVTFNEIIAKGINFIRWNIVHNASEYRSDWDTIEYAQVISQDNEKTIMNLRYLTTYDSEDGNFELDSNRNFIILHNKPLSAIKKQYNKEEQYFNDIIKTLIDMYGFKIKYTDTNGKYEKKPYKEIDLSKTIDDDISIGEAKKFINNCKKYAKESVKMTLTECKVCKHLCFANKGAFGGITLKHYIQ